MNDATAYYRSSGVLPALERVANLEITMGQNLTWLNLVGVDLVFLQRPHGKQFLKVAELVKEANIPLVLDFDDDFFSVPFDNPTHGHYSNREIQKSVAMMCNLADAIIVSTKHLKDKLSPTNKNIHVVPNALNDYLMSLKRELPKREKCFIWRGGQTHQNDLMSHAEGIVGAARKLSESDTPWPFVFVGYNPWFVTGAMPPKFTVLVEKLPMKEYLNFIKGAAATAFVIPLARNEFNLSKSNIAWLEATWAGSITIGPNTPEWRVPGCITTDGPRDMMEAILEVTKCESSANEKLAANAWEYVCDTLLLSRVNEGRLTAFQSVLNHEIERW